VRADPPSRRQLPIPALYQWLSEGLLEATCLLVQDGRAAKLAEHTKQTEKDFGLN